MIKKIGSEEGGVSYWVADDNYTHEKVTIKSIPRGPTVDAYVEREVHNRRTLLHPHITRMREVVMTETSLDIVMDFAPGRDLAYYADQFAPLSESHSRRFFQQIIIAVDFCHKRETCVRNLRLDNLALNTELDIIKLQNFKLSKNSAEQSKPHSRVGTCDYAAPEVVMSDGIEPYDGYAVDVWASGVCLFALLYGYLPFSDVDDTSATHVVNTCARIRAGKLTIPDYQIDHCFYRVAISNDCLDLMHRLLEYDPQRRITVAKIMEHPWFLEQLPPGALEMNAAIDPIDDKLHGSRKNIQQKSVVKHLLACAAQPLTMVLRRYHH